MRECRYAESFLLRMIIIRSIHFLNQVFPEKIQWLEDCLRLCLPVIVDILTADPDGECDRVDPAQVFLLILRSQVMNRKGICLPGLRVRCGNPS